MSEQLWGGRRAPFTLIGGYLGAGKTTLLNSLLTSTHGLRLAVLVNDVGGVNVDAALIADHDGDTLTLTNGCVCCTIGADLGVTLEQVRAAPEPPDHVVMELSGVSEPARVAPWANTTGFRLDGIVVVADADQLPDQTERSYVADAITAQLKAADLIVLSKTDLAIDGGRSARAILERQCDATIVVAEHGDVDPVVVLGLDRQGGAAGSAEVNPESATTLPYRTDVIELGSISGDGLRSFVETLDPQVVRAKGAIQCFDTNVVHVVHVVGSRRTITARPDLAPPTANQLVVITLD